MIRHLNSAAQPPERIVLLGARGFIAAALRRAIEASGLNAIAIGSAAIDLTAADAAAALVDRLRPTDAVIMLAALTPDKGRDSATLMANLAMMRSVCSALEQTGAAHLMYVSSDAVYGPTVTRVTEQTLPAPADLYGAMHLAREIMAAGLARIPLGILRVTGVYGAEDPHNSYGPNRFRRMARSEGRITVFGRGEETRDHVHVDDVARLALECLMWRSVGSLNVATGISTSFKQVARLVASHFRDVIPIVDTPRATSVTHRHYDVTPLIKAFPSFRFVGLAEGVEVTCRLEQDGGEARG